MQTSWGTEINSARSISSFLPLSTQQGAMEEPQAVAKRRTPLPKFQVFILLFIQFAEPVTALVIYPFIMQFIRDIGITGGDESKTGYFAGIIESVFFLAECLTVFWFGRASDRYGRRPVLLFGPFGLALSMLGFGMSKYFWSMVVFRCMQGAFNGNIGVAKSVMAEISDSTNIAEIYALLPLMWTAGVTIGPFIGGTFANPAATFPGSLGKIHVFQQYPYLLPCAMAASLAFLAFTFGFLGLKESLPSAIAKQKKSRQGTETEPLLSDSEEVSGEEASIDSPPPLRELITRPVVIALTNHAFLCFCQMSYDVMIPLVYATPIELGGLGLTPQSIGRIMGIIGFANVFTQTLLAPKLTRRFGAHMVFRTTFILLPIAFLAYPLLNHFARKAGRVDGTVIAIMAVQLSASFSIFPTYGCTQIFLADAAPPNGLGGVNGIAQMASSTLRSIAPSLVASLFATSVSYNLLGGNLVFVVLFGLSLCGLQATFLLPKQLGSEN
ncbi:Major facilitator superfamily multidrug-resistance DHA1 sub-family [Mycena indigotica]|uniref:Major facilitator superfamily multidrug-resistance DHA1 sub-family n=1 Tax=Mycena indigotica TaxID=2126181 RepID=A0A8H6T9W8_9AGAR|nr:Major facilitator superfamily multidrug-resistance DHA1 sub-family [Mycena indigotica]KAF7312025.1 Major facilitator superfamily multidrug-resistance DHA1 sub-family [Mycena indigotica]